MKKSVWTIPLLAAFVIAVSGGAAFAIPSLGGPTGIVTCPNALVAPSGQLQTALTFQQQEYASEMYGGGVDVDYWALNVLTGVSEEAELWAAYAIADQETPTDSETANMWALGGKYQLAREPEDQASLAIGGSWESWSDLALAGAVDMYGGLDDVDVFKLYVVATKDFTPMGDSWEWSDGGTRMLGSLGLMYINVDADSGAIDDSLTRPFVGLEFVGAGGTTFGLEYRWDDDNIDMDAVFSAVLRHAFSPEIEAEIGTTNAGPSGIGLDDQNFFVRVGYNIPLGAY
ncbi:MAG: hypothetical protein JXA57_01560 [Armatimonadetes bacterium]|nr:hypothetical protein [Armatimonadota bacterium]